MLAKVSKAAKASAALSTLTSRRLAVPRAATRQLIRICLTTSGIFSETFPSRKQGGTKRGVFPSTTKAVVAKFARAPEAFTSVCTFWATWKSFVKPVKENDLTKEPSK